MRIIPSIKTNFTRLILFASLFLGSVFVFDAGELQAQNIAYKTLLSTLYDNEFPTIKPEEVKNLSDYQVLDTREKNEFEVSHLQNATWVGFDDFNIEALEGLDRSRPVLVYCTVGARSQEIGKKLSEMGFTDVFNLYGGIIHWVNEGNPVYRENIKTDQVHTYSMAWGIWLTRGEKVYD